MWLVCKHFKTRTDEGSRPDVLDAVRVEPEYHEVDERSEQFVGLSEQFVGLSEQFVGQVADAVTTQRTVRWAGS